MELVRFYWLVVREAFRHSLDIAQAVIFVVIGFGGFIVARNPAMKPMIDSLDLGGWQIAAIVFGSIVAVRLVLAPYWLWRRVKAQVVTSPLGSVAYQLRVSGFTNRNDKKKNLIQIVFQIRNSHQITSMAYEVEDIDVVVNGFRNDNPTFVSMGGVVAPNSVNTFDYPAIQLSGPWIKPGTEGTASITYKYGIAGQPFARRAKFTANIIIQKNDIRHLTIEDSEAPI